MAAQLLLAAFVVTASVACAMAALVVISLIDRKASRPNRDSALMPGLEPTVFLFDDRELVDATAPARALLHGLPGSGGEWDRLAAFVTARIPDFLSEMATLSERGTLALAAPDDPHFRLGAESLGGLARLTLSDLRSEGQGVVVDALSLRAQESELAALREMSDVLPLPVWRSTPDGDVVWANRAYLGLIGDEDDPVWPLPAVFNLPVETSISSTHRRIRPNQGAGNQGPWFDCQSFPSGHSAIHVALPANAVVRAEASLRDFVQTLTKTFADLSIGLAIFDRQRQLALFNPALVDLTSLGAEFLAGRPTLFAFLDRLREARVLPEPKDYTGWRQQMTELEKAASAGRYEETWTLTTGQTYKVTGRPHPDGAVAFLFEDISAEISLTRRFRAELEMGQGVIDALEDAVAVFSPAGDLVMSNTAYARLWGIDPGASLGSVSIIESTRLWATACLPNPAWGDLRDFVGTSNDRSAWEAEVTLLNTATLACQIIPMAAGATLVKFIRRPGEALHVRRVRSSRTPPYQHTDIPENLHA